jgi:hypothetical protein
MNFSQAILPTTPPHELFYMLPGVKAITSAVWACWDFKLFYFAYRSFYPIVLIYSEKTQYTEVQDNS